MLSGTAEALLTGRADIAITPHIPPGFFGELLMRTPIIAVAHPEHPLHKLGRQLTQRDLRGHRHITVRDTGSQRGSARRHGRGRSTLDGQPYGDLHRGAVRGLRILLAAGRAHQTRAGRRAAAAVAAYAKARNAGRIFT